MRGNFTQHCPVDHWQSLGWLHRKGWRKCYYHTDSFFLVVHRNQPFDTTMNTTIANSDNLKKRGKAQVMYTNPTSTMTVTTLPENILLSCNAFAIASLCWSSMNETALFLKARPRIRAIMNATIAIPTIA